MRVKETEMPKVVDVVYKDNFYANVGMGMAWTTCVNQAATELGYTGEQFDRKSLFNNA